VESKQIKKSALDKLMNKVSQNGQSQIEGISVAKKRGSFVSSVDETLLDLSLIDSNPYQPRKVFNQEKIAELAEAIKANGLITPIAVRKVGERYQVIAGERRLRAIKLLGSPAIQAVIFDADDEATSVMALSENIDREDLSDYEVGQAIHSIEHLFKKKTELGRYTGKTRSDIYRYLSYGDLPDWVKGKLNSNPNLVNRNNAQLLISFFSEEDYLEDKHKEHVNAAFNMIEAGALTQTMLMPKIRRLIRDADNPRRQTESAISKVYSLKGKKVGMFSFDDNKMVIKLNSAAINEEVANSIHQMVADALSKL
jgi:ParB family transcriptional regulator, chromosome partitioning protein